MDLIDFKILTILQNKARIPNVEIARQIKMAPSAVLERIKKLEARGIIEGYEVRINPKRFNSSLVAFIQVRLRDASANKSTGKDLAQIEEIQEIHNISGADCLLIKLRTTDIATLEKILSEKITSRKNVKSVKTHISLCIFKETARIALTEPDSVQ
ncbi:MAG: Lrp/AsnC family transcriptional regulator [Thermodesulfobacteriota bacterium]|nr:Lrp/AsnC family transcriptional regulator [Thermodesulfobacteriota bacterium]